MSEQELNSYLAADATEDVKVLIGRDWPIAVDGREVIGHYEDANLPVYGPGAFQPVEWVATFPAKDMHPETLSLLTGLHPENFDIHTEGRALVEGILERKKESIRMKPLAAEEQA